MKGRPFSLVVALLSNVATAQAQERLLSPGPLPVGFTSSWQLDPARTYRTAFDEGATYGKDPAPRPLLVNLWYPARAADGDAMPYGDYFEIAGPGDLESLSRQLGEHARGIFVQQVLGTALDELDVDGLGELEALLEAPTGCRRGAEAAEGPFPLVVWHSGAESSFEDDALFCEFLASHGFVVVGSAFQEADGSELGVDGGAGSVEDIRFLARHAGQLAFVDGKRLAVAGHSLGAQATLRYAATPGATASALVLLDTTQDYYGVSLPLFGGLVQDVERGADHIGQELLAAAGPEAHFQLLDRLTKAERLYLTVPDFDHDDFISQGHQRRGQRGTELSRLVSTRADYAELCALVLAFLSAQLDGEGDALLARIEPLQTTVLGGDRLHVEFVPRGTSAPPPYDPEGPLAPTPRQFRQLVDQAGAGAACAVLERFRDAQPRSPIYTSSMLAGSMLYELGAQQRKEEAHELYACVRTFLPEVLGLFEFLADMSRLVGHPERARSVLDLAHELDPERPGILERLR